MIILQKVNDTFHLFLTLFYIPYGKGALLRQGVFFSLIFWKEN